MPQASSELQDMFPGMDTEAMGFLELHGIKPNRGGLFTVNNDADYPPRVWAALQYLRDEWDYDFTLV